MSKYMNWKGYITINERFHTCWLDSDFLRHLEINMQSSVKRNLRLFVIGYLISHVIENGVF